MESITIEFKDGRTEKFRERGRAGGSYTLHIRYEGSMAIITDEYEKQTAFPTSDIKKVVCVERQGW